MERPIAVIEICSKCIKLVVGFVIDGQVQVIYSTSKNLGLIFDHGTLVDENAFLNGLRCLNFIEDTQAKLKITIAEVIVVIPPLGLTILESTQTTNLVNDANKVETLDIRNLFNLVLKMPVGEGNVIADAIPRYFELDGGRSYSDIPLGLNSSSISAAIRVHSIPSKYYYMIRNAVSNANFIVKRVVVAPQGGLELLSTYHETPSSYYLVDIGSNLTTVSMVGGKQLFDSRFFFWGGDSITEKIIAKFNINEADAEKYKIMYGYDNREYSFDPIVCTSYDGDNNVSEHHLSALKEIIKDELDDLALQINSSIKSLLESYGNKAAKLEKLPIVLVGGGALLGGLVDYLKVKLENEDITLGTNRVLGARSLSNVNALGAIICQHKYPAINDDSQRKNVALSREIK